MSTRALPTIAVLVLVAQALATSPARAATSSPCVPSPFGGVSAAFTAPALIQAADQCENALALCHESADSTPYACDDAGAASGAGLFACYDLVAIDSNACGTVPSDLRRRTLAGIEPTITRDGQLLHRRLVVRWQPEQSVASTDQHSCLDDLARRTDDAQVIGDALSSLSAGAGGLRLVGR